MLRNLKTPVKSIGVLSLVLLAAPFIKPDAALAGGFTRTCERINVQTDRSGAYLQALCKRANGQKVSARLNLSAYIANRNGKLVWSLNGGGFHRTCRSIRFPVAFGQLMGATCKDNRQRDTLTAINLDEKISNQNGVLAIDR
jgi:hypothetical protein